MDENPDVAGAKKLAFFTSPGKNRWIGEGKESSVGFSHDPSQKISDRFLKPGFSERPIQLNFVTSSTRGPRFGASPPLYVRHAADPTASVTLGKVI